MKHWIIAAAIFAAIAEAINAELSPDEVGASTAATGGAAEGEPAKRRGRPPGSTNTPKPAETPAASTPAASAETPEQALEKRKAIIKPYVDAQKGEEVKKIIAKYSTTGLKDIPDAKLAEFKNDLATLDY